MSRSRTRVPLRFTRHSSLKVDKAFPVRRFRRSYNLWVATADPDAEPEPRLMRFITRHDTWSDYVTPVIRNHDHTVWQFAGRRYGLVDECDLCGPDKWKYWRK